jgi:HEAT repeat protein
MISPSPLPRTLEASFRDLGSERAAVRASAIRDVVRHAAADGPTRERALPMLERALSADVASSVRAAAAIALADLGARETLPSLLVAVEDDDAMVRQMALTALGEIGDARAGPRLERALRDSRPEVRYQAVIAYARVARDDGPAVARSLASALDDGDSEIRYIAVRLAEEHFVVGDLPGRMAALLDRDDAALAVAAGIYLVRVGDARGRPVVVDVVAERRRSPVVEDEQACVELAGELKLRDAVPFLERRAWGARRTLRWILSWGAGDGASCAWHARTSLAQMGHERARAEIEAELTSWRGETRAAAAIAAARAGIPVPGQV